MIKLHEFNSKWWKEPVGIIQESDIENFSTNQLRQDLKEYAWVEYKGKLTRGIANTKLHDAGFRLVDVQIPFRMPLIIRHTIPSISKLNAHSASESPFVIQENDFLPFKNERFCQLYGITPSILNNRFYIWANDLIKESPDWCLQITYEGKTMGWFLSQNSRSGLQLTLAMLSKHAAISGLHLYQKAITEYEVRGAMIGFASFSATNTPVMNIYASLNARFLEPIGCWIWQKEEAIP